MDCGRVWDQLGFYIDGAIDQRTVEQVEMHLAECSQCRAELASLRALIVAAQEVETLEPPPSLRASIAAATTGKRDEITPCVPVMVKLREMLTTRTLAWSGGLACAGLLVSALVRITPSVAPPAHRAHSPAPIAAATRPSVAAVEPIAVAPTVEARQIAQAVTRKHVSRTTHTLVAEYTPIAKPKSIASAKPHSSRRPAIALGSQASEDAAVPDDTTVAQAVAPNDIQKPDPKMTDAASNQTRIPLIKVASSPTLRKDDAEQWLKQMKTEAAMKRRDRGGAVLSVINAKF